MKKYIRNIFAGKSQKINALIAFALVGSIILGCNCNKNFNFGKSEAPSAAETQVLVQGTMQSFASAVESEDFSAFYAQTSKQFQQEFTKEYLTTAFKVFTDKRVAVVPVLRSTATLQPAYSPAPTVSKAGLNDIFDVRGIYATSPVPTKFTFRYVQEGSQWKIIRIEVYLQ